MLINPSEMEFVFNLDKCSCYEKYKGICSLDMPFDNVSEPENSTIYISRFMKRNACQSLYLALKDNPETGITSETIRITKYKCGHHLISGGQHRICIARRKGLLVEAEPIEYCSYNCRHCNL